MKQQHIKPHQLIPPPFRPTGTFPRKGGREHGVIKSHAKCILVGEHAVLRGHPAIVFPVLSCGITLEFLETGLPATIDTESPYNNTVVLFFWGVLKNGLKQLNRQHSDISGQFFIRNTIPMGAGLGFSAAFCAVITQWFLYKNWIEKSELIPFARKLEDGFHGRSSGVDIAGALASRAIYFENIHTTRLLDLTWKPKLYLSYSNQISVTAQCIETVDKLWLANPLGAQEIDRLMYTSVIQAEQALSNNFEQDGLDVLKIAINQAYDCFKQWGLIPAELEQHIQLLRTAGAIAIKPTGAGMGGYVLSLWQDNPPDNLELELLALLP